MCPGAAVTDHCQVKTVGSCKAVELHNVDEPQVCPNEGTALNGGFVLPLHVETPRSKCSTNVVVVIVFNNLFELRNKELKGLKGNLGLPNNSVGVKVSNGRLIEQLGDA